MPNYLGYHGFELFSTWLYNRGYFGEVFHLATNATYGLVGFMHDYMQKDILEDFYVWLYTELWVGWSYTWKHVLILGGRFFIVIIET